MKIYLLLLSNTLLSNKLSVVVVWCFTFNQIDVFADLRQTVVRQVTQDARRETLSAKNARFGDYSFIGSMKYGRKFDWQKIQKTLLGIIKRIDIISSFTVSLKEKCNSERVFRNYINSLASPL